jgi:predicted Zn-dependent protease
VPQSALRELATQAEAALRRDKDEGVTRAIQRYLRQHPDLTALIPILLDRGDPHGRAFALMVAKMAATPEMLAALRDFALSQRGPDLMRTEAAQAPTRAGLLPSDSVRMWMEGEWREVRAVGYEIHSEVMYQHAPQVAAWMAEAALALRSGDAKRSESLVLQALEVEPEAPDVLNNLAAAYEKQGRSAEAEALIVQVFERHPDYLFGRVSMAQLYLRDGKFEEAKALLEPLLSRQRFHFSEFAAVCSAEIDLFLRQGNQKAADSWLEMWASADPDHPAIPLLRQRLGQAGERRRRLGARR